MSRAAETGQVHPLVHSTDGDLTPDNSHVRYHGRLCSRRHGQVRRGSFPRRGASSSTTSDTGGHTLLHERLRQFPLVQQYAPSLSCSSPSLLPELRCENETVLGNQLKSIYRFGEMAHCSTKWNEFKFCMSIKGLHPEQRRDAWIRHRAEWWARRRLGSGSENVWEQRTYVSLSLNSYCIENALPDASK